MDQLSVIGKKKTLIHVIEVFLVSQPKLFLLFFGLPGWPSGKASASRAAGQFDPCFPHEAFPRPSHTSDLSIVLQWLPCQVPDITGSVLGLVDIL